ncbi:chitosanase [Vitiosangium sp. GDMCC 1.1324]|uniref:chitosanase n=1 Tax=Vitiosangium sp. (strain GDMCC 1.1324) TaxID=2138576 RepID=UPI00130ECDB6|nr:chitosanase [Vitiosangium sp. GDMCC 1.1324]
MTQEQLHSIDEITNVFENGKLELGFGEIQNLHDGCGFTAGYIGFCTATGDLLQLVQSFTAQKKNNPLAQYIPQLEQLAREGSESTSGLSGFTEAWKQAARDPVFPQASLYRSPAWRGPPGVRPAGVRSHSPRGTRHLPLTLEDPLRPLSTSPRALNWASLLLMLRTRVEGQAARVPGEAGRAAEQASRRAGTPCPLNPGGNAGPRTWC